MQRRYKRKSEGRCSFCSKSERMVFKLIRGHQALICNECVRLCFEIICKEAAVTSEGEWESWNSSTVAPEVDHFRKGRNNFVGWSEKRVLATFGPPDQTKKDYFEIRDDSGTVIWKPDKSLVYLTLLPHVVVCFGLLDKKVGRVMYTPKWKTCPVDKASKLGNWHAPPTH